MTSYEKNQLEPKVEHVISLIHLKLDSNLLQSKMLYN